VTMMVGNHAMISLAIRPLWRNCRHTTSIWTRAWS
jgi:hypothetical protein